MNSLVQYDKNLLQALEFSKSADCCARPSSDSASEEDSWSQLRDRFADDGVLGPK